MMEHLVDLTNRGLYDQLLQALPSGRSKLTVYYLKKYMVDTYKHVLNTSELQVLQAYCRTCRQAHHKEICKIRRRTFPSNTWIKKKTQPKVVELSHTSPCSSMNKKEEDLQMTTDTLYTLLLNHAAILGLKYVTQAVISSYLCTYYPTLTTTSQQLEEIRTYCHRTRDNWSLRRRRSRKRLNSLKITYIEEQPFSRKRRAVPSSN